MGKAPKQKNHKNFAQKGLKKSKYMSRSAALHFLQVPLARFRQLCILKGVYPRDIPHIKGTKTSGTYYSRKDIIYMSHDPLIEKFREWKVFMKKFVGAKNKDHEDRAQRLAENTQVKFKYDHLVKERYPTFQSALGDLDDCLTLLFLFARMPAEKGISTRVLQKVKRLCDEFCTYVTLTRSLRKVFLSFKGIYYQANILGQVVSWVVPYDFPHTIPSDVDFSVFQTFLNFYETFMAFINYKLFQTLDMSYPPAAVRKDAAMSMMIDLEDESSVVSQLAAQGHQTAAAKKIEQETEERLQGLEAKMKSIAQAEKIRKQIHDEGSDSDDDDDEEMEDAASGPQHVPGGDGGRSDEQKAEQLLMDRYKSMFSGLTFFISRECPRAPLEFLIKSFGGRVGWDAPDSKISRLDSSITHEIVDRNSVASNVDREFIQPQWVFDCVNARIRLPIEPYRPGQKLPPHLSPFVQYDDSSYIPKYALDIRKLVELEKNALLNRGSAGTIVAVEDDEQMAAAADGEEDEDEVGEEALYVRELKAEKSGKKFSELQEEMQKEKEQRSVDGLLNPETKKLSAKEKREQEEIQLREMMMSRTARKKYQKQVQLKEDREREISELKKRKLLIEMEEEKKDREQKQRSERLARENALFNMEDEQRALDLMSKQEKDDGKLPVAAEEEDDDEEDYEDAADPLGNLDDLGAADDDDEFDLKDIVNGDDDDAEEEEEEEPKHKAQKKQKGSATAAKKQPQQPKKQQQQQAGKKRKHTEVSQNSAATASKKSKSTTTKSKQPQNKRKKTA